MRFWLARNSDVPLREQLVTQITLGVLSGDLAAGRRLPSTREMARRFRIHANTVSAAYRELEEQKWVEFRHGSGVYISDDGPRNQNELTGKKQDGVPTSLAMDQRIAQLFRSAREARMPLAELRSRLNQWLTMQPPDHFLLIEPDEDLRDIVMAEMRAALQFGVAGCGLEECRSSDLLVNAVPVVLPSKAAKVRKMLPDGSDCITLQVRSVTQSLALAPKAKPEMLIGVASRWPGFLKSARTMLVAAGFDTDSLIFRDARKPGWERPLRETTAVVCDALTATRLPKPLRAIPFALLSEASLEELRRYESFVASPLN